LTNTTKEKRDCELPRVRVSATELRTFKDRASNAGLSLSDFARMSCLDGAVIVRENAFDVRAITQLSQVSQQLAAIGNNLNQLTKRAHIQNEHDPAHLQNILNAIEAATIEAQTLIAKAI
jgi:hypothetical protein|tara:strand:- start:13330 stop:13689 length:360 start_codon:yes stop_codon:yes gene_type:complete